MTEPDRGTDPRYACVCVCMRAPACKLNKFAFLVIGCFIIWVLLLCSGFCRGKILVLMICFMKTFFVNESKLWSVDVASEVGSVNNAIIPSCYPYIILACSQLPTVFTYFWVSPLTLYVVRSQLYIVATLNNNGISSPLYELVCVYVCIYVTREGVEVASNDHFVWKHPN